MANSDNFKPILDLLKKLDFFAGSFVFQKDSDSEKNWKEKLVEAVMKRTLPTFVLNALILFIFTMVQSKFSTISIIMSSSMLVVAGAIIYVFLIITVKKSQIKTFLDWCASLHNVEQKFHPAIRGLAENHFDSMKNRVVKILKWARVLMYFDVLICTCGFACIGNFLPEKIYPKFSLPLPYLYPFKNQKTWMAFFIGVLGQTKIGFDGVSLSLLAFGIVYCIVMHISTYLDIIKATVRVIKDQLEMKFVMEVESIEEEAVEDPDKIEVLNLKTLSETLQSIQTEAPDDDKRDPSKVTFEEWIKIIVDMITDVNEIVSKVSNFFSGSFLFIEYGSLGCFFLSGMIFLVIHQQFVLAVGVSWLPMILFMICFANEMILSKFSEITQELYNLPWYALTVKEQKTLLVALECENIQVGFNAGSFHTLTQERFLTVLHLAYKNVLVLRNLAKM